MTSGMGVWAGIVVLVLATSLAAWNAAVQRACRLDPAVVKGLSPRFREEGAWAEGGNLEKLEKIYVGLRPEDLAVDSQGRVYTGVEDGWIKRVLVDGTVENHTYVEGRALGIAMGPDDDIYFADSDQGLFKISKDGTAQLLTNEVDGKKILFADGVVVAKNGDVYFTDASTKFVFVDYLQDILEGRANGQLLKFDPATGKTSVVAKDLFFPNGVALSEDEDFLLIPETSRAQVRRYWLKGDKQGTLDTFLQLPAYPDNVNLGSDGNFYIGLAGARTGFVDWLLGVQSRQLRCFVAQPATLKLMKRQASIGQMIVVSPDGTVLKKYEDPTGKMITFITGGSKVGDFVYFSGLGGDFLGRLRV